MRMILVRVTCMIVQSVSIPCSSLACSLNNSGGSENVTEPWYELKELLKPYPRNIKDDYSFCCVDHCKNWLNSKSTS